MNQLIEDKRTYIPYFNGNRDLPEDEQIVVTYRVPDISLRRKLKPGRPMKFNYDPEGRVTGGEVEVSIDDSLVGPRPADLDQAPLLRELQGRPPDLELE